MSREPKSAKCGLHSKSFCYSKHDSPQCDECILVKHRKEPLYKWVNGYKLKRCPRCGEYKILDEFRLIKDASGRKYRSWCRNCMSTYAHKKSKESRQQYMIGHKVNGKMIFLKVESAAQMIKYVRQFMIENNENVIDIKRLK